MGLVLWWPEDGGGARYDGVGEAPMLREQASEKTEPCRRVLEMTGQTVLLGRI